MIGLLIKLMSGQRLAGWVLECDNRKIKLHVLDADDGKKVQSICNIYAEAIDTIIIFSPQRKATLNEKIKKFAEYYEIKMW